MIGAIEKAAQRGFFSIPDAALLFNTIQKIKDYIVETESQELRRVNVHVKQQDIIQKWSLRKHIVIKHMKIRGSIKSIIKFLSSCVPENDKLIELYQELYRVFKYYGLARFSFPENYSQLIESAFGSLQQWKCHLDLILYSDIYANLTFLQSMHHQSN
jgi:hypothetical protein